MKLIDNKTTDLSRMDCHLHSYFSPDSKQTPEQIVAAVRANNLRGFIVTDHVDIGHMPLTVDFDEYFKVWNAVRAANPDLTIYIGLEVGFDSRYADEIKKLIEPLPLEYVVNSIHYIVDSDPYDHTNHYAMGREKAYAEYIDAVIQSLDAPYDFNTIGHFGYIERYAPYPKTATAMEYAMFKSAMDTVIKKAVARGVMFEENTSGGELCLPRADFLREYKKAGGRPPVLSSDAHTPDCIAHDFAKADKFIKDIFD